MEKFDVVIVGARCAGSALATMLAQRGLRVCIVDKAGFPSDKMSTSLFTASGTAVLERIGVFDRVLEAGASPLTRFLLRSNDVTVRHEADHASTGVNFGMRREVFDEILVNFAAEAGVDVRTKCAVSGLIIENGRAVGVVTQAGAIHADVVIGADGQRSLMAKEVGAEEYLVVPGARLPSWRVYDGARPDFDIFIGSMGEVTGISGTLDNGKSIIILNTPMRSARNFLADRDGNFDRELARWPELSGAVAGARQVGPTRILREWHGYFRTGAGPGWALLGDAGHFKDYSPGQGMADAFRHGEKLAEAIVAGLDSGNVDRELLNWWRWRDADAAEMYIFAAALGEVDLPAVVVDSLFTAFNRTGAAGRFEQTIGNRMVKPHALLEWNGYALWLGYMARGLARHPDQIRPALRALGVQARRIARVAASHPHNSLGARRYRALPALPQQLEDTPLPQVADAV